MRLAAAVFLIAFIILSIGVSANGLASAYIDPAGKLLAQDEATYAHSSLRMAQQGGWLTPHFLGRFALYKPPLLYWLSGAAARIIGPSNFALRLPALLAGALSVALVFLWLSHVSLLSAIAGATLLLTSHLFFVLDRVALMDPLLCCLTTAALYLLYRDHRLDRWRTRLGFAALVAAAILTKSIAGFIAPLALLIFYLRTLRSGRIPFSRIFQTGVCSLAFAAPWFLYQWLVHPKWFVAEFILTETLAWGLAAPTQTSAENGFQFYATRLWATDPALLIAAAVALLTAPRRTPGLLVIEAWCAAMLIALSAFGYHSAAYLLPLLPPLAILAAGAIRGRLVIATLALVVLAKLCLPQFSWGIPFAAETSDPTLAEVANYANKHHGRELVIIEPQDQFVSATLAAECGGPLLRIRYLYIDNPVTRISLPLNFAEMGISMTVREFLALRANLPRFMRELRKMDVEHLAPNGEPLGTVLHAASEAEVQQLIREQPEMDYYWPARAKWFTGPEPPPKP